MNYPYNRYIIYQMLCKWTCQTCFSGERLKAPWASCYKTVQADDGTHWNHIHVTCTLFISALVNLKKTIIQLWISLYEQIFYYSSFKNYLWETQLNGITIDFIVCSV